MKNKFKKIKDNRGVALIVTLLLMFLVMFLALYFLSFSLTEKRISVSQAWGARTYYLAEAGVHEMVWRLKNDATYKNNFETDPNWTQNFERTDPFGPGSGTYSVTITNSAEAHGEIIASGTIEMAGEKAAQRVVKTYVYRAMGEVYDLEDNGAYADGNINISFSKVNFYNGSAYADNNFTVNGLSTVNVDEDINVVHNYNESFLSSVNEGGTIYAANLGNPATSIGMPAVDFDSSDPGSYINIADVVYTENQFDNIIKSNSTITLNDPITYVDGDVDFYGNKHLIINGLLVVGRDFQVGRRPGSSSITVNHTAGQPSGILAKRKVYFKIFAGQIDVEGIIYASDQASILSFPLGFSFDILGGIISRKFTSTSVWQPINITFDEDIAVDTISTTEISQVITVEHWEEEY